MEEKYKLLLNSAGESLKKKGFVKKGSTFYLAAENNWGLVNFQKSKESKSDRIVFTINIGVLSSLLRLTLRNIEISSKPIIDDCHWKKRIGFLMSKKQDHWWVIDEATSIDDLISEVINLLDNFAIPAIENHISDNMLESQWLIGNAEGITELQRYIYLTTLLKLNNKPNLPQVIEDLKKFSRGKAYEYSAKEHIKELESYAK
jgi:hypothetical protein